MGDIRVQLYEAIHNAWIWPKDKNKILSLLGQYEYDLFVKLQQEKDKNVPVKLDEQMTIKLKTIISICKEASTCLAFGEYGKAREMIDRIVKTS